MLKQVGELFVYFGPTPSETFAGNQGRVSADREAGICGHHVPGTRQHREFPRKTGQV